MIVPSPHAYTPTLRAIDPRGLLERFVTYHRDDAAQPIEARVQRHAHDAMGRLCAQWDARLWADGGEDGEPNQSTRWSLSGRPLLAASVDAGWRMALFDASGQLREGWDGRGTHHERAYDTQQRPLSVHEHPVGQPARCVERWGYGGPSEVSTNGCGQLIRHDDPAGTRDMLAHGLSGGRLVCTQRFLADLSTPDWPLALDARDALLETDSEGTTPCYVTRWRCDALGESWHHADAARHTRHHVVDVTGKPIRVEFQAAGATSSTSVIKDVDYDASGRIASETAGNGVTTRTIWSAVDGRLQQRQVRRATHRLQDSDYRFDPVGNLIRSEDRAQPTTWFDGAQVDAVSVYRYDTLSQLIEATGGESVQAMIAPDLPGIVFPGGGDASKRRNYLQAYHYDASGNLLTLSHTASDGTRYTRVMAVAERSNRSLYQSADVPPDFIAGFDAHGNQQALEGQPMTWNARDQLQGVTQVVRANGASDEETYVYGGDGMRQRKVRTTQGAVAHVHEVRYLPGLEIHRNSATGEAWEVASILAGRTPVRWLHEVSSGRGTSFHRRRRLSPGDVAWRYTVDDHLGSATLELDDVGDVISHEGYYPYGGTAWWAARSELDARDKTMRYSGKERDATGLYYYGYRYYAPWLCRWINPDPAGDIDGLNRYRMVSCNPITLSDLDGRVGWIDRIGPGDPGDTSWKDWSALLDSEAIPWTGLRSGGARHTLDSLPFLPAMRVTDQAMDRAPSPVVSDAGTPASPGDDDPPSINSIDFDDSADLPPGVDPSTYSWTKRGLLQQRAYGKAVFRADRRSPDTILTHGFDASSDFGALMRMTDGPALIAATDLAGVRKYIRGQEYAYSVYRIDARDVRAVSLNENADLNEARLARHLGHMPHHSPASIGALSNYATELNEVHVVFSDITPDRITFLPNGARSPSPPPAKRRRLSDL